MSNISSTSGLLTTPSSDVDSMSYATRVNKKYQTNTDKIMPLVNRAEKHIMHRGEFMESVIEVCSEFRDRFPNYALFNDMRENMVETGRKITIRELMINCSIQRIPNHEWVLSILGNFDPFFVNVIRVYELSDGTYAIWDGQHTAIALLFMAIYGFDFTMDEVLDLEVPCIVHPGHDISKLRQRFIGVHDNTMTMPLDKIDLFFQYVAAARNNNASDVWSLRFEQIQSSLEKHGMFFTHEKFEDHQEAGAITRATEIFPTGRDPEKWSANVLDNVFEYHALTNPSRPVEPLEIDNMAHIFRACEQQFITVDSDYILKFASCLGAVTHNTWKKNTSKKHVKVKDAYQSWRKRQPQQVQHMFKERCNQTEVAPTWLVQAVNNTGCFPYTLPVFSGKYSYKFNAEELS